MTLSADVTAAAVDIIIESPLWAAEPAAEATVRRAIATAVATVRALPAATGEVSVVLTDDDAIGKLNRDWRQLDKPTNVLSFRAPKHPPPQGAKKRHGPGNAAPTLLGDIVIAYETTAREAQAQARPFSHHLAHLAVHGFLHLLGYDHESDADAQEMERLEARILARIEVSDPYAMCDGEA